MNYQNVVDTRHHRSLGDTLEPAVQERRILQTSLFLALCGLLLLVLFPSLRAQDLYTAQNLPKPGTTYTLSWAPAANVNPQLGGIGQFWDFSALTTVPGKKDTIRFVSPIGLIGAVPPKTTVAVLNSTNNRRVFYNTGKPSLGYLGEDDNAKQLIMGSDPFDIEPIPVKLNALLTAKFGATLVYPLIPTQVVHRRNTVTFSPDGSGSLFLPGATNTIQTIRVHWTEDILDTVVVSNKPSYIAHTQLNRYVWYGANSAIEYLSINQGSVSFTKLSGVAPKDSSIFETRFIGQKDAVSDVSPSIDEQLDTYPIPANNVLHISGIDPAAQYVRATLYTLQGAVLAQVERGANGSGPVDINTSSFAAQSCLLRVDVDGRRVVRKVVIVH